MGTILDKGTHQLLKNKYPVCSRIRCIEMVDDPCPIPSGSEGTIRLVDDMGTIHVKWDNGRTLGLIYDVDRFELIS